MSTELAPLSPDSDAVPGVRRFNRLPLVVVSVLCLAILAVLVYAGFQRAQQNRTAIGIGSKLDSPLDPVAAGRTARELFHEYREEPPPVDGIGDDEPFAPGHPDLGLAPLSPPDQFLEEKQRLAYDAKLAATVVPTDDLYQSIEQTTTPPIHDPDELEQPTMPLPLPGDTADPNLRKRKGLFKQTQRHYGYSSEPRRPAITPFIVRVGSLIPAVLIGGINLDLPGEVLAQVSQDVMDSRSGHHVLIPRGSRLVGIYDHHIAMGQRRVMTVWHRIQFPDDSTLDLGGMSGIDQAGYTGFRDRVNNHYWRIFGNATLLSLLGAGAQIAIPSSDSESELTAQEILAAETARQWGEVGREMVRRNLKIQPTLEVRPGYRFNVMVDKDLILPPYTG